MPIPRKSILTLAAALLAAPSALALLAQTTPPAQPPTSAPATAPAATRPLTDKEKRIDRVMEFFRQHQPGMWERARTLREKEPAQFEKLISEVSRTVEKLEDLRKRNPKLFELNVKDMDQNYESMRLAKELKKTDLTQAERDKLTRDLNKVVAEQFDTRQKLRQMQIDEQAQKLKDLEAQLKDREKIKADLIKKRMNELLEKPPQTEW